MRKSWKVAASVAAMMLFVRAEIAAAMDVGAMAAVRQTVYGVPPQGGEAVKRKGDAVVFQETLQTVDDSGALIRFIDESELTLGAKSKVVIDEFVFDLKNAKGHALIEVSVGTLRFVTGEMPKGGVVIKTPTATLTLRGTDVVVHVHPDGTTDTAVYDGKVEAQNNLTDEVTHLIPGDGATLGQGGTTSYDHDDDPADRAELGSDQNNDPPEHRRSEEPKAERPVVAETPSSDDDDDGGCDCI